MPEFVHVARAADGVATLSIDNPPWNNLSRQVDDELVDAAQVLDLDPAIRVVIVYGGPKLFCAGADLAERAALTVEQYDRMGGLHRGIEAIAAMSTPTIAAITGHAIGEGVDLAAATDFRVAGDNVRFGLPEVRYATMPSPAALRRLCGLIGSAATIDLARSGRSFGAEEALRLGLVDAMVAPDDVLSEAVAVAGRYRGRPELLAAIAAAVGTGSATNGPEDVIRGFFADPDHARRIADYLAGGPAAVRTP